ncbi:hypothetical protein [Gordonia sp. MMO-8]|uniref:hypothetical protein n=1 Tax=Gordonia sp. MMO-8 TaxID=3127886 RepID=UPI00301944DD
MAWFKVDDGFWTNPKVIAMSEAAASLWVRAGSYACQNLTDGRIDRPVLRFLGTDQAADELVTAGLWRVTATGWVFHDWAEYQELASDVKARRSAARERQRRHRAAARESRELSRVTDVTRDSRDGANNEKDVTEDVTGSSRVTGAVTNSVTWPDLGEREAVTRDSRREFLTPDPTRPDQVSVGANALLSPSARDDSRPSDRCTAHAGMDIAPPCGACADARRSREAWDETERRRRLRDEKRARQAQADVERAEIEACALCDDRGYANGRVCAHDPEAGERARRGIAAAREAVRR